MRIGIEVELHSDNYSADYIAEQEWLNFNEFTFIPWMEIWVKLSREYYASTIEYNFTPFENSLKAFKEIRTFLEWQISKYWLYKHCSSPAYVWTHIHIFDEDKINMRIPNLLEWVSWFIIDNINSIDRKWLMRLLFAHQLWGNYSWRHNHIWKEFLNNRWHWPSIYDNTRDKPKYNPIIFSLENINTWKPKSLEIRLIPNEFMFDLKAYELMDLIDKRKLSKNKKDINDLFDVLYNKIFSNNNSSNNRSNNSDNNSNHLNISPGTSYFLDRMELINSRIEWGLVWIDTWTVTYNYIEDNYLENAVANTASINSNISFDFNWLIITKDELKYLMVNNISPQNIINKYWLNPGNMPLFRNGCENILIDDNPIYILVMSDKLHDIDDILSPQNMPF